MQGIYKTAGIDVNTRNPREVLQATALHEAVSGGQIAAVQLLIDHGADVNARDAIQNTPLHTAASKKNASIIRILLRHGANKNARNEANKTPHDLWNDLWG